MQVKVPAEIQKLLSDGHITKLDKCRSDCFVTPVVITVKKNDSIKLALDARPINRQLLKNKYPMTGTRKRRFCLFSLTFV